MGIPRHRFGFEGVLASQDCEFELRVSLRSINVQHIEEQVSHYALWVCILTMIQVRCFSSQMRYTEDGPSAAKLSMLGVAMQALMDAYDSFLHLALTSTTNSSFNTFAIISLSKFVLFSLVEVRYVLIIWRCKNREAFSAGWEEVRRHIAKLHSNFYSALFTGLVIIFHFMEHLHVFALLFQLYWVPQIVHDIIHGSKAAFQTKFLVGISVTRSLHMLYLWGCPKRVFDGDLYPALPEAPSRDICVLVILFQAVQVGIMLSQQAFGPRWFVPRICLPHVYDYHRASQGDDECVICMGELAAGQASVVTPCDHHFHESCLERWMDIKMECPTCRAPLPPIS